MVGALFSLKAAIAVDAHWEFIGMLPKKGTSAALTSYSPSWPKIDIFSQDGRVLTTNCLDFSIYP
jgi:hypothetical protein